MPCFTYFICATTTLPVINSSSSKNQSRSTATPHGYSLGVDASEAQFDIRGRSRLAASTGYARRPSENAATDERIDHTTSGQFNDDMCSLRSSFASEASGCPAYLIAKSPPLPHLGFTGCEKLRIKSMKVGSRREPGLRNHLFVIAHRRHADFLDWQSSPPSPAHIRISHRATSSSITSGPALFCGLGPEYSYCTLTRTECHFEGSASITAFF